MTKKEKLELMKNAGFSYEKETGIIFSPKGKVIEGISGGGYIYCNYYYQGKIITIQGAVLAYYLSTGKVPNTIDHIDRNKLNNKYTNLRNVTTQENAFNSNAKGYYWQKSVQKWHSNIAVNSEVIYLGLYNIEEEARQAYLNAKEQYHIIKERN